MGRPPSPWLQRAYEILADGKWHRRDDVIAEMAKLVPPGVAYRRGLAASRTDKAPHAEMIRRGARHVCQVSLNAAGYIRTDRRDGSRIRAHQATRRPLFLEKVSRQEATHVLIPIAHYRTLHSEFDGVKFVREAHRRKNI